jgi:hypothetical protein
MSNHCRKLRLHHRSKQLFLLEFGKSAPSSAGATPRVARLTASCLHSQASLQKLEQRDASRKCHATRRSATRRIAQIVKLLPEKYVRAAQDAGGKEEKKLPSAGRLEDQCR